MRVWEFGSVKVWEFGSVVFMHFSDGGHCFL